MSPYLRCPKCGKQEYGVLSVHRTECQRRCRACLYRGTVYLPEITKKIIYIDQFAFSNIVLLLSPEFPGHEKVTSQPFWKELFEILSVVCHIQLVVCPDSRQHHHESLTAPFAKSLKHTYEHFSGGASFEDSETIKARQVSQIAKCWLKKEAVTFDFNAEQISSNRLHEWSDRIFITVSGELPGRAEELRRVRGKVHEHLQEIFAQWQRDKKPFKEVLAREKAAYRENLINGYREQVMKRMQMPAQIMSGQRPSLDEILPSWAETQMYSLQHTFGAHVPDKKLAAEALGEFLHSNAIDNAPFSVIGASMYASLSKKSGFWSEENPESGHCERC